MGAENDTQSALDKWFPGALTGEEAEDCVYKQLVTRGYNADNTLYCDVSCPDEINHDNAEEDMTGLMITRWGEIFPLGGLAGLPFTGKTGWHAFSSHCPNDGNIVVMFAPHVGIDMEGNVGKVLRDGQDGASAACGAAIGSLAALKANPSCGDFPCGILDHQMDCIKHLLRSSVDHISAQENEQVALVYQMYRIIEEYLENVMHTKWRTDKGSLTIFGGIMINAEGEGMDRFLPLKLEVRTNEGTEDLFEEAFGARPSNPIFESAVSNCFPKDE